MRGGHVHRRSRAGRGTGAGPAQGRGARGRGYPRGGCARGVRSRLRVPDVPRQRDLRRRVPARHLHRPTPDRQAPRGYRRANRRRCSRPRRHRQGQRPGAVRARSLRARPRHQDHRPVARVGPPLPRAASGLWPPSTASPSNARAATRRRIRWTPTCCTSRSRATSWKSPRPSPTKRCGGGPAPPRTRPMPRATSSSPTGAGTSWPSTARRSAPPP